MVIGVFGALLQAFRIDDAGDEIEPLSEEDAKGVVNCELTIDEFADSLSLKPTSLFVKNMFDLIDKNKNGLVSFREFLDMIVIFAKGIIKYSTICYITPFSGYTIT